MQVSVSRTFMMDAANYAGDDYSSRAPGLTSWLHGSVNVPCGFLLLVSQLTYIWYILLYFQIEMEKWN